MAGQYLLVIGEVLQTGSCPVIRAMKIQDLSEDNTAQSVWKDEVHHLKTFLASYYENNEVTEG